MIRTIPSLLAAAVLASACASSEPKPDAAETQPAQEAQPAEAAPAAPDPAAQDLPATPPPEKKDSDAPPPPKKLEKKDTNKMERSAGDDE